MVLKWLPPYPMGLGQPLESPQDKGAFLLGKTQLVAMDLLGFVPRRSLVGFLARQGHRIQLQSLLPTLPPSQTQSSLPSPSSVLPPPHPPLPQQIKLKEDLDASIGISIITGMNERELYKQLAFSKMECDAYNKG